MGSTQPLSRRMNRVRESVRCAKVRTIFSRHLHGEIFMPLSSTIRVALIALATFVGINLSSSAHAESGTVSLVIYKAGWFIGGSGGSGTLTFRGRTYRLSTGGLDYGLVFGGSKTVLRGRV